MKGSSLLLAVGCPVFPQWWYSETEYKSTVKQWDLLFLYLSHKFLFLYCTIAWGLHIVFVDSKKITNLAMVQQAVTGEHVTKLFNLVLSPLSFCHVPIKNNYITWCLTISQACMLSVNWISSNDLELLQSKGCSFFFLGETYGNILRTICTAVKCIYKY